MPGLVNGHFHSPVNHMKGALDSLPLEIFMLYESPASEALRPSPREAYLRTMLAALEMLRGGTTAVQDDAFFVPHPTPDDHRRGDAGLRGLRHPRDRGAGSAGGRRTRQAALPRGPAAAGPARHTGPPAGIRARPTCWTAYRHLIDTWHGFDGNRLRAAVSCSAPQRVSPRYLRRPERAEPGARPAVLRPHAGDQAATGVRAANASAAVRWCAMPPTSGCCRRG